MAIPIEMTKHPKPKQLDISKLGFGNYFTDHMFTMWWRDGAWVEPKIIPYAPIPLDPAAMILHYSQEVFEGLKGYPRKDGEIGFFRPEMNIKRFNASCERMQIPVLDEDLHMEAIETLVDLEREWCPREEGTSLYIRPTVIATEPHLGVRTSGEFLFYIILSPVGAYFAGGFKPTKIAITKEFVRAAPGGTGFAKTAGNYAASLAAQAEAVVKKCDQVLFLDAVEKKYIEEMGGMNFFALLGDTLTTPPLTGTILPGITRDSILTLAKEMGLKTDVRQFSVDELLSAIDSGKCKECFACGTAAVATSIGTLQYDGADHKIADGEPGELTLKLYRMLVDLQSGSSEDKHGWTRVCPRKR